MGPGGDRCRDLLITFLAEQIQERGDYSVRLVIEEIRGFSCSFLEIYRPKIGGAAQFLVLRLHTMDGFTKGICTLEEREKDPPIRCW